MSVISYDVFRLTNCYRRFSDFSTDIPDGDHAVQIVGSFYPKKRMSGISWFTLCIDQRTGLLWRFAVARHNERFFECLREWPVGKTIAINSRKTKNGYSEVSFVEELYAHWYQPTLNSLLKESVDDLPIPFGWYGLNTSDDEFSQFKNCQRRAMCLALTPPKIPLVRFDGTNVKQKIYHYRKSLWKLDSIRDALDSPPQLTTKKSHWVAISFTRYLSQKAKEPVSLNYLCPHPIGGERKLHSKLNKQKRERGRELFATLFGAWKPRVVYVLDQATRKEFVSILFENKVFTPTERAILRNRTGGDPIDLRWPCGLRTKIFTIQRAGQLSSGYPGYKDHPAVQTLRDAKTAVESMDYSTSSRRAWLDQDAAIFDRAYRRGDTEGYLDI